jgi:hypothetical protein
MQWAPVLGQVASDLLLTIAVAPQRIPKSVASQSQEVATLVNERLALNDGIG